jgi:histidyl-tRNA synthetase
LSQLLDQLRDAGFTSFAAVRADSGSVASLEFKPLGGQ